MQVFVKRSCIRKLKESSPQIAVIQITTTIIFTVSIAFFVVILGMFVNGRLRKFLVSEDFSSMPNTPFSGTESSKKVFGELGDWIAPRELWHSMSDGELMWRASMVPHVKDFPYNRTLKVAFMFMSRQILPLAPLWELFFKGHEGFYTIYLHISSESVDEPVESSVFYKRRIPSKAFTYNILLQFIRKCNLLTFALFIR